MDVDSGNSSSRPNLRAVAELAGVSHMTVSRVVRGDPVVRPMTAARVQDAIQTLGYRPDPSLSALAAYRQKSGVQKAFNVAFLDRDGTPYSRFVYEGLKVEAQLHGYSVDRYDLKREPKEQTRLMRMLSHRGVRGLLFGPSNDEWSIAEWDWKEFAMVSLGALMHEPKMHSVSMDYFDGAFRACRLLQKRGCQRIGFAVEPMLENRTGHRWIGGYTAAMSAKRLMIYDGGQAFKPQPFGEWCQAKRLDAVLTVHPNLFEAWSGDSKNFILLNDLRPESHGHISRLFLDPKQVGAEGMRILHHLLLRREYGVPHKAKRTEIEGTWQLI